MRFARQTPSLSTLISFHGFPIRGTSLSITGINGRTLIVRDAGKAARRSRIFARIAARNCRLSPEGRWWRNGNTVFPQHLLGEIGVLLGVNENLRQEIGHLGAIGVGCI